MSKLLVANDNLPKPVDVPGSTSADLSRLVALDATRGFALSISFVSYPLVAALRKAPPSTMGDILIGQMTHSKWDGVTLFDVGWPGYLFLTGIVLNLSLTRRFGRGEKKLSLFLGLLRKSLLCVLFAFFLDGGFSVPLQNIYFSGIFFRYALTILVAGAAQLLLGFRGVAALVCLLVFGYSVATMWGTYYCFGTFYQTADANLDLVVERFFGSYVLTRYLWFFPRTMIASLCGLLIARVFQSDITPQNKALWIAGLGYGSLNISWLMSPWIQINKPLWTTSYSLSALGISCLVLAAFYQVIVVWGYQGFKMPWVVFGANPLAAWAANELVPFDNFARRAVGYAFEPVLGVYNDVLLALVQVTLCWLFFYWLYRQKLHLRL